MRYFIAVAEELHFGRAAERLHMAQPPLSQQIKKLEEELGVQLFARTKRKVELTPAGSLFLSEARLTLRQADRAKQIAIDAQQGVRGLLRVGFVTSASYSILPSLVRRFRRENPLIDLELLEMSPCEQLDAMERGTIDVGLLRPPVGSSCLEVRTLIEEPLVAALPVDHRMAEQQAVDLETLAEDAFVLFPRHHGPGIYDVIMKACHEAGFVPEVSYAPNEMQTILAYVAGGLGVSLVPLSLSGFHHGSIVYRSLRGIRAVSELALIRRREDKNKILNTFLKLSIEVSTEYGSQFRKTLPAKKSRAD
jgi:DNA-binding transcriptional LysR family regulator